MKTNRYSQQQKEEFVAYALAHPEQTAREIAATLGVGHSTLSKWLNDARKNGASNNSNTAERERIRSLEREVAHLKEVNEIIKKAHVYFINHPSR